ncbi:Cupredoxin [Chlamydoabsidia padenii]|nr:Cupredoxin [Chlamydoabsidia padenii]
MILVVVVEGKLRTFELNISKGLWNPVCGSTSDSEVMLVNGQYPGPAIHATINDDIHVIVRNQGDEPTTVHFHGILQIGTTESDGMPYVTQAPIMPGGEFHHRFRLINQTGTYFYHAHIDLQDDSVQGPFIIYPSEDAWPISASVTKSRHDPVNDGPFQYDDERIVQLGEWWAQGPTDRLNYYLGDSYRGFIAADSYLINGRGSILKSNETSHDDSLKPDDSCPGFAAIDVSPGKVYRLRVIGALSFATVGFSIAKHNMTIIEMDGTLIQPYETDYLEISSGQRFSVLLKTEQPVGTSYNIGVQAYWITNTTATGHAILNYLDKDIDLTRTTMESASDPALPVFPPATNQWVIPDVSPLEPEEKDHDFNAPPDRTIILMPKEQLVANKTRWMINDRPMPMWQVPIIDQLVESRKNGKSFSSYKMNHTAMALNKAGKWDGYDEGMQTYPIRDKEVIDFVIHTSTLINHNICAAHPWHSHGFVHYPIAHGPGEYIHERDNQIRNFNHPVAKDTTVVYPIPPDNTDQVGTPCGWTKIRVYSNNPGLWAFHCHITGHMLQGMMIVVEMATEHIKYLQ